MMSPILILRSATKLLQRRFQRGDVERLDAGQPLAELGQQLGRARLAQVFLERLFVVVELVA